MESGELFRVGLGTFLTFAVFGSLFFMKGWLRKRLLPGKGTGSGGESMAELFSLHARLEAKVGSGESPEEEDGEE